MSVQYLTPDNRIMETWDPFSSIEDQLPDLQQYNSLRPGQIKLLESWIHGPMEGDFHLRALFQNCQDGKKFKLSDVWTEQVMSQTLVLHAHGSE